MILKEIYFNCPDPEEDPTGNDNDNGTDFEEG